MKSNQQRYLLSSTLPQSMQFVLLISLLDLFALRVSAPYQAIKDLSEVHRPYGTHNPLRPDNRVFIPGEECRLFSMMRCCSDLWSFYYISKARERYWKRYRELMWKYRERRMTLQEYIDWQTPFDPERINIPMLAIDIWIPPDNHPIARMTNVFRCKDTRSEAELKVVAEGKLSPE